MKGTVVFFSSPKGWGFLRSEDDGKDYFVHHTAIVMTGYRELKKDQSVEFETEMNEDTGKIQAANVQVIA
jgi:CspA family cold shock protein